MTRFFLLLSVFAMIVSVTVCVSHIHNGSGSNNEISVVVDSDSQNHSSLENQGCDMACGGCCIHHIIHSPKEINTLSVLGKGQRLIPDTTLFVSDLTYSLKRPPKA